MPVARPLFITAKDILKISYVNFLSISGLDFKVLRSSVTFMFRQVQSNRSTTKVNHKDGLVFSVSWPSVAIRIITVRLKNSSKELVSQFQGLEPIDTVSVVRFDTNCHSPTRYLFLNLELSLRLNASRIPSATKF